jgi:hypothetical protein
LLTETGNLEIILIYLGTTSIPLRLLPPQVVKLDLELLETKTDCTNSFITLMKQDRLSALAFMEDWMKIEANHRMV